MPCLCLEEWLGVVGRLANVDRKCIVYARNRVVVKLKARGVLLMANWRDSYKVAVLETNWLFASDRIAKALSDIEEALLHADSRQEVKEMNKALESLNQLRSDVASWRYRGGVDGDGTRQGSRGVY
jgi:hypothetical protein